LSTVPGIPWGTTTNTSQTINLPQLQSARIYVSNGPLGVPISIPSGLQAFVGPNTPAPWTGDASVSQYFDFMEYTYNSGGFNVDTTQVDAFSLALTMALNGSSGIQHTGFKAQSVAQVQAQLQSLDGWKILVTQYPYRIIAAQHGFPQNVTTAFPKQGFLDSAIQTAWQGYASSWITLSAVGGGFGTVFGQVDAAQNFRFYLTQSTSGTLVATIPSPFSATNQAAMNWFTASGQTLSCNGAFLLPSSIPANGGAAAQSFPENATNAGAAGTIGNKIVSALNRGVFAKTAAQEDCTPGDFYIPPAPFQNQFAAAVHNTAKNTQYGYNKAYAFSYDDQCGFSTDISDSSPTGLNLLINPTF
jgi:hypothetical protein